MQAGGTDTWGSGTGRRGAGAKALRCDPVQGHMEGPQTPTFQKAGGFETLTRPWTGHSDRE